MSHRVKGHVLKLYARDGVILVQVAALFAFKISLFKATMMWCRSFKNQKVFCLVYHDVVLFESFSEPDLVLPVVFVIQVVLYLLSWYG